MSSDLIAVLKALEQVQTDLWQANKSRDFERTANAEERLITLVQCLDIEKLISKLKGN